MGIIKSGLSSPNTGFAAPLRFAQTAFGNFFYPQNDRRKVCTMNSKTKRLDDSTLEVIAELICGAGAGAGGGAIYESPGPYRSKSEIYAFFERAGVSPKGESSTRKWFVLESLQSANQSPQGEILPVELERILLRLSSPKEYRGDIVTHRKVVDFLNKVLKIEGKEILLLGTEPQVRVCSPELPREIPEYELTSPPDFQKIVEDPKLSDLLTKRWEEAQKDIYSNCYLSAIIMMGSLLEGALLYKVEKDVSKACKASRAPKKKDGKAKPIHEWSLHDLIEVSHELGWLHGDVKRFSHALRDYRNMVHPYHQRALSENPPDKDTCIICWEVVKAAISDLFGGKL